MPAVLLIGDPCHPEFAQACWWLRRQTDLTVSSPAEVRDLNVWPTTIVLAQSYPGQISHRQVDAWLRRWPLARCVGLLGSWCEGEMRTGNPWPGVTRIYWHQWSSRLPAFVLPSEDAVPGFPRTLTEDERFLQRPQATCRGGGFLAVVADSYTAYESIEDICTDSGYVTTWLRGDFRGAAHTDAIIWNSGELPTTNFLQLAEIRRKLPTQPLIALLGFPRRHDVARAMAAGADCVVSKPFLTRDLLAPLADLLLLTTSRQAA